MEDNDEKCLPLQAASFFSADQLITVTVMTILHVLVEIGKRNLIFFLNLFRVLLLTNHRRFKKRTVCVYSVCINSVLILFLALTTSALIMKMTLLGYQHAESESEEK